MRLTFEDKSYIEVSKSNTPNKVFLTVAAKSAEGPRTLVINSVELTSTELLSLLKSVQ